MRFHFSTQKLDAPRAGAIGQNKRKPEVRLLWLPSSISSRLPLLSPNFPPDSDLPLPRHKKSHRTLFKLITLLTVYVQKYLEKDVGSGVNFSRGHPRLCCTSPRARAQVQTPETHPSPSATPPLLPPPPRASFLELKTDPARVPTPLPPSPSHLPRPPPARPPGPPTLHHALQDTDFYSPHSVGTTRWANSLLLGGGDPGAPSSSPHPLLPVLWPQSCNLRILIMCPGSHT